VNQQCLQAPFLQEDRRVCLRESLQPPTLCSSAGSFVNTLQVCSMHGMEAKKGQDVWASSQKIPQVSQQSPTAARHLFAEANLAQAMF